MHMHLLILGQWGKGNVRGGAGGGRGSGGEEEAVHRTGMISLSLKYFD